MSQEQFAHRAGISRNQYQLLEAGLSDRADRRLVNPRLSTLVGIARVHGLSTSELVAQILGEVPIERNGAPANLAETTPGDHGHARDAEGTATPRHRRRSAT